MLRTNLPDSIELPDGTVLYPVIGGHVRQQMFYGAPTTIAALIAEAKRRKIKYRRVEVLHRNLRGKLDLHGQPYRPTKWVFVEAMPDKRISQDCARCGQSIDVGRRLCTNCQIAVKSATN